MSVLIGHASISEKGTINGVAGDQTGREVFTRSWYAKPWNVMLICTDKELAKRAAQEMRYACANDNIGYGQNDRTTAYSSAKANGRSFRYSKKGNTDCSQLIAGCYIFAGLTSLSPNCYTGNLRAALLATGKFKAYTDAAHLKSEVYAEPGTIYLKEGSHVVMALENGSKGGGSNTNPPTVVEDTYTVKKGDSLSKIAKAWGLSTSEIALFNNIANLNLINIGQVIRKPGKSSSETPSSPTPSGNTLVRDGQVHANNFCGSGIETDGIRGTATKKAAIKVLQTAMNLDYGVNLSVDGVWDAKSEAALKGHTVRYGETQYMITALQILLMLQGYDPNGLENPGQFGDGCATAVYRYQNDKGLESDKIAGYNTFKSLIA